MYTPRALTTATMWSLWSMMVCVSTAYGQPALPIESIGCPIGFEKNGNVEYRTANYGGLTGARVCQIDDRVEVKFKPGTLETWLGNGSTNEIDDLVLGVDGQSIPGSNAQQPEPKEKPDTVIFRLVRQAGDADNLSAWKKILPKTKLWDSESKLVSVVDSSNGTVLGSLRVGIRVAPPAYIVAMGVLTLMVVLGLLVLAWRSDILKDIAAVPNDSRRPYSLAMTQMAFWFTLVFGGFIYLALVLGSIDVLSTGALGLIGVSATTGVFATAIGGARRSEQALKRQQLLDERQRLEKANTELRLSDPKFSANMELLDNIETDLRTTTADNSIKTFGGRFRFFSDLLCSDGNVSLPRFQMISWTLAFGLYYVYNVVMALQMPEFSATALGLLGLSSGTYVGFKFPSKDGK
jgi:hypothetical protein